MQTFRAGGPGGQHQNVTDSAVRLVHRPSGLTVTSRAQRSQYMNKMDALRRLRRQAAAAERAAAAAAPGHAALPRPPERRLAEKSRRAAAKRLRRPPSKDD